MKVVIGQSGHSTNNYILLSISKWCLPRFWKWLRTNMRSPWWRWSRGWSLSWRRRLKEISSRFPNGSMSLRRASFKMALWKRRKRPLLPRRRERGLRLTTITAFRSIKKRSMKKISRERRKQRRMERNFNLFSRPEKRDPMKLEGDGRNTRNKRTLRLAKRYGRMSVMLNFPILMKMWDNFLAWWCQLVLIILRIPRSLTILSILSILSILFHPH